MKEKKKEFEQFLYHEIDNFEQVEEYLENTLPLIGYIVMYFNGLEKALDSKICEIFTDRTDSTGLIVLHKMNYYAKVDLFKRFCEYFHSSCNAKIEGYEELINNLRKAGELRNSVVHADWENTDEEGYTYVNFRIFQGGMEQEYKQFSEDSLLKIIDLIFNTRLQLNEYWEKRNEALNSR